MWMYPGKGHLRGFCAGSDSEGSRRRKHMDWEEKKCARRYNKILLSTLSAGDQQLPSPMVGQSPRKAAHRTSRRIP